MREDGEASRSVSDVPREDTCTWVEVVCADERSGVSVVEVDSWTAEEERGEGDDGSTGGARVDVNISAVNSSLDICETLGV